MALLTHYEDIVSTGNQPDSKDTKTGKMTSRYNFIFSNM